MNTRGAILPLLTASTQFADLDPIALRAVAASCRSKLFTADQMVFREGDPCRSVYILESGRVNFFRANTEGREQILKVFERPGDMFCIASAFSTKIHIVSGRAVTETRLHLLDMDAVNTIAREHPSVGLKIVSMAGEQMTHLVGLADDLSLKSAAGRLAKYLYDLAVAEGARKDVEVRIPRDRLRAEELASMLGMVRVHISRSLTTIANAGAIEVDRRFVHIRDLAILKGFFEGK